MKKPIYKKWWFWVIIIVLIIGISGAAFGGGDDQQENAVSESGEDKAQGTAAEEPDAEKENAGEKGADTENAAADKEEASDAPAKSDEVTITEQVLLEQDGIKITAKELAEDSIWGPELKVLIENSGEKNVTVQVRSMSVNGIMAEPLFSVDVAAGKSANDAITLMSAELKTAGITTIQNMEFAFHVFDTESWDTIFDSENIYLATSADGTQEQAVDDAGQLVLEQDGVSITVKEVDSEESFWGADIYVYIQNDSDQNVTVQARSVSINGFMVEPMFSCDIAAGKKAYDTITFLDSELTENGIESIDEMNISFHIFNTESWDTIFDSEDIHISFME